MNTVSKLVALHIPTDRELLAAVGEVALRHEHMNYILRMTIKSLSGITATEAIAATKYESSRQLRDRVRGLARKRLGEGPALLKLQAIVASCEDLTEQRNDLIHGLWAIELDGDAHIRDAHGRARPVPTASKLYTLAAAIDALTTDLNHERLEGFLHEALSVRAP